MKISAKAGWQEHEEALLFERARRAREDGAPLKSVFEAVAMDTGRKPNSIRNYYYARVKTGVAGQESFHSAAFVPFSEGEVRRLMRTVLSAQSKGVSVRACTLSLGNGDTKAMLRYQNKYRAVVKNDPALVQEIISELRAEGLGAFDPYENKPKRAQTASRLGKLDALGFFEELEALAVKYKQMVM